MLNLFLNLENPEKSDIQFKINEFKDDQRSITILPEEVNKLYKSIQVIIIKSINNFKDIELIGSAASAIEKHTYRYSLYCPFIIGARSDRKFEVGGDCYFDDVIMKILDQFNFDDIFIIDPHCDRDEINPISLWYTSEYYQDYYAKRGFIFPDKSAYNRFERFDSSRVYCFFDKKRTENGVVQEPFSPGYLEEVLKQEEIIIFDDLFDGGASFIGLCEKLRIEHKYNGKITIFVSHFIGSDADNLKRLEELGIHIYTSNSYKHKNEYTYMTCVDVYSEEFLDQIF